MNVESGEYMYRIINRLEMLYHTEPVNGVYELPLNPNLTEYSKKRIIKLLPFPSAKFKGSVLVIPKDDMIHLWKVRRCPGCVHRRLFPTVQKSLDKYCLYSVDTNQLRNCSVEDCFYKKIHFELREG